MSHSSVLKRMCLDLATYFGHLNSAELRVLVQYVVGVILARCVGQATVCAVLNTLTEESVNTIRQRLRELLWDAKDKAGKKRRTLEVTQCFAPLLRWVEARLVAAKQPLVLALDATYLKDRFVILSVSAVVAGTAIPVAWHIQRGDEQGGWNDIWKRLLDFLRPACAPDRQVFVLTDSGLFSQTLFKTILALNWVPMMRTEATQGLFQPLDHSQWFPLKQQLWPGMPPRMVRAKCFKTNSLLCTIIFQWRADCDKPCLIVTSLLPDAMTGNVYTLRYWIEAGFKDFKRGLFNWHETKMTCPKRAERLWLVMSIALLHLTVAGLDSPLWNWSPSRNAAYPSLSAPRLGWIALVIALLKPVPCPCCGFHPPSPIPLFVKPGLNAYP